MHLGDISYRQLEINFMMNVTFLLSVIKKTKS